ncbi:protein ENL isoform X2 [Ictalurus furcatus]|uniref:protein ENL isoform X2 n=1 Tax=Ictalurus furcatus TaxID=66913 RepID=UPI00235009AC|nr:protein ENL isoform X2 [Ictalurus furcatus]
MVVPEEAEMMPRAGADYSMLSTTALFAFSDHKNSKSHHALKEPNKDRAGVEGKGHEHYKPNREHGEHKDSDSKTTSREREREGGKSTLKPSSSSSLRKSTENRGKEEGKNMAKMAFKELKITARESKGGDVRQVDLRAVTKRPSSITESSNPTAKKLKSFKRSKEGGSIAATSQISSITAAPPSTYLEKKRTREKSHWVKMRRELPIVNRRMDSDSTSEDETLSRSVSVRSNSSSSCSSSSSDSEFGPLQMQSQEYSDDDRCSEVETAIKATIQDSRLFMDSDSDVEESHPHSQEVPSPIPKLNTKNIKMLEKKKKSSDSCKREKVLKGDKVGRVYTEELVDLHHRLMALSERKILQQIVNLIEKTGHFNVTKTTFDFDLFSLDESTVRKLQNYVQAKRT